LVEEFDKKVEDEPNVGTMTRVTYACLPRTGIYLAS